MKTLLKKKTKYFKKIDKRNYLKTAFILIPLIIYLFYLNSSVNTGWISFVSDGPLSTQIYKYKNKIVFGISNSKLKILSIKDSNKAKDIEFNSGAVFTTGVHNNLMPVLVEERLAMVDLNQEKVLWKITNDSNLFYKSPQVIDNSLLVGSTDGSLIKVNVRDGKILWKFSPNELKDLGSVVNDRGVEYFGEYIVESGSIYLASHDGGLYVLDLDNGKIKNKVQLPSPYSANLINLGNYILFTTKDGNVITYDKKGKILLTTNNEIKNIFCLNNFEQALNGAETNNPATKLIRKLSLLLSGKKDTVLVSFREGGIALVNVKNGKTVWKTEMFGNITSCPSYLKGYAVFTTQNGKLVTASVKDGRTIKVSEGYGTPTGSVEIVQKGLFWAKFVKAFQPSALFLNKEGTLFSVNVLNGNAIWKFKAGDIDASGFRLLNNSIIYTATDGVLYKINLKSGKPLTDKKDLKYTVEKEFQDIGEVDILELTLTSFAKFENPWRQADIYAVFKHQNGKELTVPGFYYDNNKWKIRFNPPDKGEWEWILTWKPHGDTVTSNGKFISYTETGKFYVKKNNVYKDSLSLDGKTVFNGIGLGESLRDYNYNGNYLDDWATGDSQMLIATSSGGVENVYRSKKIVEFDEYLNTYGPKGAGFNVFRWSLTNASPALWTKFGFPTEYSLIQGKIGDDLVKNLKKNDIHIWFTIFGFDIPYKDSVQGSDKYILSRYVKYLYARYGSYIDFWELANEFPVPKHTAEFLKSEITKYDFEKRSITVSSDEYNLLDGDIIAPHWYQNEELNKSDLYTFFQIDKYKTTGKPVVFTEQGNLKANYDKESALRMRVRAWTAFFNKSILVFWNQSDTKNFTAGVFPGNIYLGEEERKYVKVLQTYTKGFPLNSWKIKYDRNNIRGYGLGSHELSGMYFFHHTFPNSPANVVWDINVFKEGEVSWINPADGLILKKEKCNISSCRFQSPSFNTDIVAIYKNN